MLKEILEKIEKKPIEFLLQIDGKIVARNGNADVIQRKFNSKKYHGKDKIVLRTIGSGTEDITDLFV